MARHDIGSWSKTDENDSTVGTRRPMIRIALGLILCATGIPAVAAEKPNVVVVLFDDLGYGEPACYRPESTLRMPHLDRLAGAGMRFTDAHSAAVCTPTRYGLLTGRYPSRVGQYGVFTSFDPPLIPESRLTVASFLKRHGYETACIGKWHLGLTWQDVRATKGAVPIGSRIASGPNQLGFDFFHGFTHARNIETNPKSARPASPSSSTSPCVRPTRPSRPPRSSSARPVRWTR